MKKTVSIFMAFLLLGGLVRVSAQEKRTNKDDSGFNVVDSRGDSIIKISSDSKAGQLTITAGGLELLLSNRNKEEEKTESSSSPQKEKKNHNKKKDYNSRLGFFEIGMNDFMDTNYNFYETTGFMSLRNPKSINYTMNLLQAGIAIDRRQILGISSGVGLVWNNYVFSEDCTIEKINGKIQPKQLPDGYYKSKLTTFGVRVPVMLDLNINKFFISGGVYGEAILNAYTKVRSPKQKSDLDYVSPFQWGYTARVGCGDFYVYGTYAQNEFFQENRGPRCHTATIGIGLGL